MTRRAICACLLLTCLSVALTSAQTPAPAAPAPQAPEPPKDPLGRDTPRGTVLGFMSAARDNKQEVTPLYLNSGLSGEAATELAQQALRRPQQPAARSSQCPERSRRRIARQPAEAATGHRRHHQHRTWPAGTHRRPCGRSAAERASGCSPDKRCKPFRMSTTRSISSPSTASSRSSSRGRASAASGSSTGSSSSRASRFSIGCSVCSVRCSIRCSPSAAALLGQPGGPKLTQVHGSVRLLILAAIIRWFVLTIDLPLLERQLYAIIRVAFLICGLGLAAPAAQRLRRAIPAATDSRVAPGRKHRAGATRAARR